MLSLASGVSSSCAAASKSRSSMAKRAMARLSSGERGVDAIRAWRWSAPSSARVARTPAAGSAGSTAGTGRNCHRSESGDAPSSALNNVLGAATGLPPSSATT